MAEFLAPGIYVEEVGHGPPPIPAAPTSTPALLGEAVRGPARPRLVTNHGQYQRAFGDKPGFLSAGVRGFFDNGGRRAFVGRLIGGRGLARCLAMLEQDAYREVALVAVPGLVDPAGVAALIAHCEANRRFAILDCPRVEPLSLNPRSAVASRNAAAYAPWLAARRRPGARRQMVPPSGHVLGIYARTDAGHGVWTAPANAAVHGAIGLDHVVDDNAHAPLAERGVNVIRSFAARGILIWGARTLSADPEWKYINVRRLFLFLERSIDRGTQWVLFEPNAEPLWTTVRVQIENFLHQLWREGALRGDRPSQAYFVRCDRSTMTQADIESGRLIAEIGFAPIRPAEFVVFRIGQWTCESCR